MWVLIDSQSTVGLFYNADLLTNIKKVDDYIIVHCNAGHVKIDMMGNLTGHDPVWYYCDEIANILSLYRVSLRFHIQFDSRGLGNFMVWKDDGTCREFKPGAKGLYYSDYDAQHETILLNDYDQERMINTMKENLKKFTHRQIADARTAQRYQNTAGLARKAVLRMVEH